MKTFKTAVLLMGALTCLSVGASQWSGAGANNNEDARFSVNEWGLHQRVISGGTPETLCGVDG